MSTDQAPIFAILVALFVLFVWGRWRYDVVAFLALLAAVVAGVVPFAGAFRGFGHPATVTVALVLVMSRALSNSGAVDLIAQAEHDPGKCFLIACSVMFTWRIPAPSS